MGVTSTVVSAQAPGPDQVAAEHDVDPQTGGETRRTEKGAAASPNAGTEDQPHGERSDHRDEGKVMAQASSSTRLTAVTAQAASLGSLLVVNDVTAGLMAPGNGERELGQRGSDGVDADGRSAEEAGEKKAVGGFIPRAITVAPC